MPVKQTRLLTALASNQLFLSGTMDLPALCSPYWVSQRTHPSHGPLVYDERCTTPQPNQILLSFEACLQKESLPALESSILGSLGFTKMHTPNHKASDSGRSFQLVAYLDAIHGLTVGHNCFQIYFSSSLRSSFSNYLLSNMFYQWSN